MFLTTTIIRVGKPRRQANLPVGDGRFQRIATRVASRRGIESHVIQVVIIEGFIADEAPIHPHVASQKKRPDSHPGAFLIGVGQGVNSPEDQRE